MVNWFHKHGCRIVIANHEHVVHESEFEGKCFHAYAIGNCLSSAGTLHTPFDRYSNYSVAVHAYIDEKNSIDKVSFSILKSVKKPDNTLEVWPTNTLYSKIGEEAKRTLLDDCSQVSMLFSRKPIYRIEEEYFL